MIQALRTYLNASAPKEKRICYNPKGVGFLSVWATPDAATPDAATSTSGRRPSAVRKREVIFALLFFLPLSALCNVWILENATLRIGFDDKIAALTVLDKRCHKQWQQYPAGAGYKVTNVTPNGKTLRIEFGGDSAFVTVLNLVGAELEVTLSAPFSKAISSISYPNAFRSPANHLILLTDSEGMALPVADKGYPMGAGATYFCGGGVAMSWMGVTDASFATGYMAILETPYDVQIPTERRDGAVTFKPVWIASKGSFGYHRRLRYVFFDKGGYVAQCKRYRQHIWPVNRVQTLRQKAAQLRMVDKMMGGIHIYVWDNARNAAFAQELKDSGIRKAVFLWNPNHPPYPTSGYDDSIARMGFVPGVYELPTDAKLRDTAWYDLEGSATPFRRTAFPGLYNKIVARKKDGSPYTNQFGHFINPAAVRPHLFQRFRKELGVWSHQTYFMDVYAANGVYEDWSKENPLTREGWAKAIHTNQQYLIDSLKQFIGAEWGADFTNDQVVYAHGMMTNHRTWWGTEIGQKGTIYYTGDWKNGARPTQMLGTRTAPPLYLKYSINEAFRVPLYELVYHDAVVTSWRWEDANHHTPEIWWKKDLFNALYGNAPLWNLDQETWTEYKATFMKSYATLQPWMESVAYDEMLSHRFVTRDGSVQESVFSSGKRVWANFSDDDLTVMGKRIPARGFVTF